MPYRSEAALRELLTGAPLADVRTGVLEVESEYADFDEFWDAARAMKGPETSWMQALGDDVLAIGREAAHSALGSPRGSFLLRATAAAVRGVRS